MKIDTDEIIAGATQIFINEAGRIISSGHFWTTLKMFVHDAMAKDIPGTAKHAKVKADMHVIFGDLTEEMGVLAYCFFEMIIRYAFIYVTRELQAQAAE